MTYANATTVPVEKSRAEIERLLMRYNATRFVSGWSSGGALVGFELHGRGVRFMLPLPVKTEPRFQKTPERGLVRGASQVEQAWEQECRARWRALLLVIKAKLEAVESGITTFETEFLPYTVLPGGATVAEEVAPRLHEMLSTGGSMPLLPVGT